MKRPALLLFVLLLAATTSAAQTRGPAFDVNRLARDIRTLASDEFEGRGPVTAGEVKTVEFIVGQMRLAGLEPGGALVAGARGWTQDVPLLRSDITGASSLSVSLGGRDMVLTQGEQISLRAALTGQSRVSLAKVPLVFVGYGVSAPERQWDDFKGADLKGKVMVVLVNDPDFEGGEGDFGGKAMTYYGRWTYKYEEAARRGAAGVLVIHEDAPAAYGWATVKNSNTNTMFDIVRPNPAAAHTPMEGWIQRELAAQLFQASGTSLEAAKAAARRKDFRPMTLGATMSADYAVKADTIVSKNVLGRLTGRARPDETVIYSAHWDHLGMGLPDARGDRIYNGAVDNATGVAGLLELARAFAAAPRTQRSMVFLALAVEEKGLLGSEYYAANPVWPLGRTAGVLNMDSAYSLNGKAKDFSISGSARLGLLDMLIAEGRRQGRSFSPDPRPEAGLFFRSDHFSMAKVGVPAISYKSGEDLEVGGTARGKAAAEAYIRDRYHQPADEWGQGFDLSGAASDLSLLYAVGRTLADGREWPNWSTDSEFRAARDRTAAERR